ncbi:helix-turn-helix domain-containing protein [Zooshikella ganghwensis]|uniref:Helix-turn-helix domain-containing protein n=1 Tax=Zooshikella ganghwensis TaxID=202772 RepID=A0A4P9VIF3_9GAMM|nr:helix-turn-helix domain-containing protein [Zooshikella ganghwensis]RDH41422.1 helix-turn-helix domain-containing protein [Zooshikella ganghwensis]
MGNSLHTRIAKRRKELKLTQKEVGEFIGVSDVSVGKWEKGESSPKGKNLKALAEKLQCSMDWIIHGGNQDTNFSGSSKKIPLITLKDANKKDIDTHIYWETCADVGLNAYAIQVYESRIVNFTDKAIIIVDPDEKPQQGDIVVARIKGTVEAVIKKLVFDGPNTYLDSLNSTYKPIEINDRCSILGVVKRVEVEL